MANVILKNVYKKYKNGKVVISDLNLEIGNNEFVVIVGPSGSGKSTILRMIAGLEEITYGQLIIDNVVVNNVPPKNRDVAFVFQNYAMIPHFTVYENLAYPLKVNKLPKKDISIRVMEAAELLDLKDILNEKSSALSGGQMQRVALGRAIVRRPSIFLMDEPLSNLDPKMRMQMRAELVKIQEHLGATFIYVTHDQTEAMTMGKRIVVLNQGVVQQYDTPHNLYNNPLNMFVATFIGIPPMNFFKTTVTRGKTSNYCQIGNRKVAVPNTAINKILNEEYFQKDIIVGIRPEDMRVEDVFINSSKNMLMEAYVDFIEKLGNENILFMKVDGKEEYCTARVNSRNEIFAKEKIKIAIDTNRMYFFDMETQKNIALIPQKNYIEANLLSNKVATILSVANLNLIINEKIFTKQNYLAYLVNNINPGIKYDGYKEILLNAKIFETNNNYFVKIGDEQIEVPQYYVMQRERYPIKFDFNTDKSYFNNDILHVKAKLFKNKILSFQIGRTIFDLPFDFSDRLIDDNYINSKLLVGIDSKDITLCKKDESIREDDEKVLYGKIEYIDYYSVVGHIVLYIHVIGINKNLVSFIPIKNHDEERNTNYKCEDKVIIKFNINKVTLHNINNNECILASSAISKNFVYVDINKNDDFFNIKINKQNISLPCNKLDIDINDGKYCMEIDTHTAKLLNIKPDNPYEVVNVIECEVIDIIKGSKKNIVYVKLLSNNQILNFVLDADNNIDVGDKIFLDISDAIRTANIING